MSSSLVQSSQLRSRSKAINLRLKHRYLRRAMERENVKLSPNEQRFNLGLFVLPDVNGNTHGQPRSDSQQQSHNHGGIDIGRQSTWFHAFPVVRTETGTIVPSVPVQQWDNTPNIDVAADTLSFGNTLANYLDCGDSNRIEQGGNVYASYGYRDDCLEFGNCPTTWANENGLQTIRQHVLRNENQTVADLEWFDNFAGEFLVESETQIVDVDDVDELASETFVENENGEFVFVPKKDGFNGLTFKQIWRHLLKMANIRDQFDWKLGDGFFTARRKGREYHEEIASRVLLKAAQGTIIKRLAELPADCVQFVETITRDSHVKEMRIVGPVTNPYDLRNLSGLVKGELAADRRPAAESDVRDVRTYFETRNHTSEILSPDERSFIERFYGRLIRRASSDYSVTNGDKRSPKFETFELAKQYLDKVKAHKIAGDWKVVRHVDKVAERVVNAIVDGWGKVNGVDANGKLRFNAKPIREYLGITEGAYREAKDRIAKRLGTYHWLCLENRTIGGLELQAVDTERNQADNANAKLANAANDSHKLTNTIIG